MVRRLRETLKKIGKAINNERDTVKRVTLRTKRVISFYTYMQDLYSILYNESVRRALPAEWCSDIFLEQRQHLITETEGAIESAEYNYGKRKRGK